MSYRVVEYDSGPTGMSGMDLLISEWEAKGYSLQQIVRGSAQQWVLLFSLNDGVEQPGSSPAS
ncbi:hypothetical protein CDO26_02355 [Sinorhizobium meliloti]|nr:hypothetical protein [Sinorhizobium meliloti]ASP86344.1 hypothetical protein CDO26_02355 [Sinorhizobium meliloti]ASP93120.1 hypothetical protein CDO25_05960 [Sinorhizobium meliloti]RVJ69221.1 hypothetical protein CN171_23740 [Sinorhizobium meliloti]RVP18719.1 hypothetical protein CN080_28185 [Sinorhizobium meliloti]